MLIIANGKEKKIIMDSSEFIHYKQGLFLSLVLFLYTLTPYFIFVYKSNKFTFE